MISLYVEYTLLLPQFTSELGLVSTRGPTLPFLQGVSVACYASLILATIWMSVSLCVRMSVRLHAGTE